MHKWLLVGCMSLALTVAGVGLNSAQAQYGGHCHSYPGVHSYGYSSSYSSYRPSYGSTLYHHHYSPYAGAWGSAVNYGTYFGPSVSIGRRAYSRGYGVASPIGIGSYGYGFNRGSGALMGFGF